MHQDFAKLWKIVDVVRDLKCDARPVTLVAGWSLVDKRALRGVGPTCDGRHFVRCSIFRFEPFGSGGRSEILLTARRSRTAAP